MFVLHLICYNLDKIRFYFRKEMFLLSDIIKDVEFDAVWDDENDSVKETDKKIRGKALYFSTGQVADVLEIPESTVRYYSSVFDEILNIEISNKRRRYKEADIDKLRFIKSLIDDGMTLKQVKEYCQEVDFHKGEVIIREENPLGIQALAKALMDEQSKKIELMKNDILTELKSFLAEQSQKQDFNLEKIREDICIAVDDSVNEKLR